MSNAIFVGIRSSLEKAFAGACSLKEQKFTSTIIDQEKHKIDSDHRIQL